MKFKQSTMKKWFLTILLIVNFNTIESSKLEATNCTCAFDPSGGGDSANPYYQAGMIFGAAFASAFTTKVMPWLSEQLKNGNARQFIVNMVTFWRKSPPHPVLTMFPSLAGDMSKELEFIVKELDKVAAPVFHGESNTVTYAVGDHAYFFRLPEVDELDHAYDMKKVTANYVNGGSFAPQTKENMLASAIFKVIDTLGEPGASSDVVKFRRHLSDVYREWLRKGRVYPLFVSGECVSLLFDINQLEFGFMKTSADNANIATVIDEVNGALATRKSLKDMSVEAQIDEKEIEALLNRLTIHGSSYAHEDTSLLKK
ncbi:MAG: hypothetical protein ACTHJ4_04130 [Candidatus Nucleicultricaceae bacterium]